MIEIIRDKKILFRNSFCETNLKKIIKKIIHALRGFQKMFRIFCG